LALELDNLGQVVGPLILKLGDMVVKVFNL
jgi:hypothetical protein